MLLLLRIRGSDCYAEVALNIRKNAIAQGASLFQIARA